MIEWLYTDHRKINYNAGDYQQVNIINMINYITATSSVVYYSSSNHPPPRHSARRPRLPQRLLPLLPRRKLAACCSALPLRFLLAVLKRVRLRWDDGLARWLACDRGPCGIWARRGWPA